MLYFIDAEKNHSKFYEMLIVQESNTVVLKRRWGALTDSGESGRVDSKDEFFESMPQAQMQMAKIYREKVGKGYLDSYNPKMHVSPTTGERLPMGQYPVGLTRKPGFGWGTQSATMCIPGLRSLQEKVDGAIRELDEGKDLPEILADMENADRIISALMRNPDAMDKELNRSMGDVIAKIMQPAMRRIKAIQGQPVSRILPDLTKLRSELVWIKNYIRKQLAYCS